MVAVKIEILYCNQCSRPFPTLVDKDVDGVSTGQCRLGCSGAGSTIGETFTFDAADFAGNGYTLKRKLRDRDES